MHGAFDRNAEAMGHLLEVVADKPLEKREKAAEVEALDQGTLDPFILFPKSKGILETKETPKFDEALPDGESVFFSVVIAAYNQGSLLQETVDSVFKQTFQFWELIIVDDASSDTTWEVANSIVGQNQDRIYE
ncbi:nucleotide-diphospho-sugar transferase [Chloropicon primus]|nr:nucleotide-diphospho-sugar transferase [Chloropicon primus]